MNIKTWEEFEKSFEECPKCDKPEGNFKGLFCHYHCLKFEEVYKLLDYIPNKSGESNE